MFDGPVPFVRSDPSAVSHAADANSRQGNAIPLQGGTLGRRAGDMPYTNWWRDQRVLRPYLQTIRARAKWLCQNNRHASTAARDVPSDLVGTGLHPTLPDAPQLAWRRWSTKRRRIHASRKLAWKGLQWMISRSVMVTGEAFIVLRRLPMSQRERNVIPIRVEIFDGDGLSDASGQGVLRGSTVIDGQELAPNGNTRAWHFRVRGALQERTVRVPASDVIHVFDGMDPETTRGFSWFSPVILDINELRGYQDSTAVKQHLASKITLLSTDAESAPPGTGTGGRIEDLEPGAEIFVPPGRDVKAFEAPLVREYKDFVAVNRGEIAVCLGTTPEALSGDYSGMSWTTARASYLKHWMVCEGHRSRWLRPAVEEVYDWVSFAMGTGWPEADDLEWQMPIMQSVDPRQGRDFQPAERAGWVFQLF